MSEKASRTELLARIETLEADLAKAREKGFWDIADWKDGLKVLGLPMAFVLALYTAYDDIYLRWTNQDAASVGNVKSNLDTLQSLNAKAYQMRASGDIVGASAFEAASLGQRERVVQETFAYWEVRPEFFQRSELQILANELLVLGRTKDGLEVYEGYTPRTAREEAEHALFLGRLYGADGDAFDLETARDQLRTAAQRALQLTRSSDTTAVLGAVLYYRVQMELSHEQDCAMIAPMVDSLKNDILVTDESSPARTGFDRDIEDVIALFEARCGPA